MKATKILYGITVLGVSAALVFSACKKKEEEVKEPETPAAQTPDGQAGTDSREVQGENDQAVSDVNEAISNYKSISGRSSAGATAAGCYQIDTVKLSHDTLLIKYNGITCLNRTRTGMIRLSWIHGTKWKNQNAVIKVDYVGYKVERASDHKSFTLNGTLFLTNVSGGTWLDMVLGQPLVNTITGGNLQATFEDNKTAVYNIHRKLTYTFTAGIPNVISAKAEGIGSQGSLHDLENFGTARNGDAFTSQVTTPIIWNTTCGGAVIQGAVNVVNTTQNATLNFTYGVDINGNPQPVGPNACPYGWKLGWSFNGSSGSTVVAYQ